jgi:hypothetical protein
MNLPTKVREELEELSKEVFGASSRYQKLLRDGLPEPVTEDVTEYVPAEGDKPEETKTVKVPVYYANVKKGKQTQIPLIRVRHFDVDSVKTYMLELKAQLDEVKAKIKAVQEEQKKKREEEALRSKVHEHAGGSAL